MACGWPEVSAAKFLWDMPPAMLLKQIPLGRSAPFSTLAVVVSVGCCSRDVWAVRCGPHCAGSAALWLSLNTVPPSPHRITCFTLSVCLSSFRLSDTTGPFLVSAQTSTSFTFSPERLSVRESVDQASCEVSLGGRLVTNDRLSLSRKGT